MKEKAHVTPPPFLFFPFPSQDYLNLHSKTCQDSQARRVALCPRAGKLTPQHFIPPHDFGDSASVLGMVPPSACRPEAQKKSKYPVSL